MNAEGSYRTVLLQKSFWLFTGKALPVIVLFLITILYSRQLSYEDYGKFQSVWMYTNLLNVITGFGITSLLLSSNLLSLSFFIKKNLLRIIGAYSVLLVFTAALFLFYGKNLAFFTKVLLVLFVIAQGTVAVVETLLIKFHQEKIVFVTNFIYSLLFVCWHYYILSAGFDLNHLVEGILFISVFKFCVMLLFRQQFPTGNEGADDKGYCKHWIYLGLNDITGVLSRWIDKLLLVYLLTAADFAVFFNGSFEIPLFALLVSVIASIMLIEMSKDASSKERVKDLFMESFRLLSLIVFPLFLFLLFFRHELFGIVFNHKYDESLPVFLISIFILPVRINNYGSVLQYYRQGNKIMYGSLLDICIAVILMISFYPLLGTRGVALAIVIATYCQVWYYLAQSAGVLGTDILSLIPVKALLIIFMITFLLFACLYYNLAEYSDETRLVTGMIATAVIIVTGLIFYFTKKQAHNNGLAA